MSTTLELKHVLVYGDGKGSQLATMFLEHVIGVAEMEARHP